MAEEWIILRTRGRKNFTSGWVKKKEAENVPHNPLKEEASQMT